MRTVNQISPGQRITPIRLLDRMTVLWRSLIFSIPP